MQDRKPKVRTLSSYRRHNLNIDVSPAAPSELPGLHAFISDVLGPGIASIDTVKAVHAKQAFSVWKVRGKHGETSGAYAFLYLNQNGLDAINENRFDSLEPDTDHLAASPGDVVAIFAWCMVLTGRAKAALLQAADWVDLCGWSDRPIFTNPVTARGSRLAQSLGFTPYTKGDSGLHAVT